MKKSCKNKSEGSTTNPKIRTNQNKSDLFLHEKIMQEQITKPASRQPSRHPAQISLPPAASFPGALGAYPGSSPGSSHKSPIFLSGHDSCSSSDSEPELIGADRVIRLLRKAKKPKQKPVYNFYEEVVIRQVTTLRKLRDDIIKHLRSTPSPKKPNDLSQPSRSAPKNDEDENIS